MDPLVQWRVRARPVSEQGHLAYGGYMALSYDPSRPWEVRLSEVEPGGSHLVFARDLLAQALDGTPAGEGSVRARLRFLRPARHALLCLAVDAADGPPLEFGLCAETAAGFLQETLALVPAGDEWRHVDIDAAVEQLLGESA
jgi:hypothetical protein